MSAGVPLADVVGYLDEYLRIREVPDEPNAVNGLQVENGGRVGGIVAAVDASQATIDGVIADAGAGQPPPLLLVHHGLFWDGNVPVTGRRYRRLAALLDARHRRSTPPTFRSTSIRKSATMRCWPSGSGLEVEGWFGNYRGRPDRGLGARARAASRRAKRWSPELDRVLGTPKGSARLIPGGPEQVGRIGIITGGAGT